MANRTSTYLAFDGRGEEDPKKSDFKYYSIILGWSKNQNIEFKIVNSHEKASVVRDSSKLATLKSSLLQRLRMAKNMVAIISKDTRKSGSLFSFEIENAIDNYKIPLIIAYPGYDIVDDARNFQSLWPKILSDRIKNESARAIHIPFKRWALLESINRFSVNGEILNSSRTVFKRGYQESQNTAAGA